jgi:hypothetical protein
MALGSHERPVVLPPHASGRGAQLVRRSMSAARAEGDHTRVGRFLRVDPLTPKYLRGGWLPVLRVPGLVNG